MSTPHTTTARRNTCNSKWIAWPVSLLLGLGCLGTPDKTTTPKTPMHVTANSLEYNDKLQSVLCLGDVRISQDQLTITAAKVEVQLSRERQIARLEASGTVTVKSPEGVATGEHASYDEKTGTVVIDEKPALQQGSTRLLDASKVTYNIKTGHFEATNGRLEIDPATIRDAADPGNGGMTPSRLCGGD